MGEGVDLLRSELAKNCVDPAISKDHTRVFHGRGGLFNALEHLSVDQFGNILHITLFSQKESEASTVQAILEFAKSKNFACTTLQKRYLKPPTSEVLHGELPKELYAYENGMRFRLDLLSNQNTLYFGDMKNGRDFVRKNSLNRRVLNLFSYTCGFSVAAKLGGASSVVNVDMSKSALSVGKANHALNGIETRGVSFLPYNILKSFSGIKKHAPFDLAIIDPPTLQRGSFDVQKDYIKIVKRLGELTSSDAQVLACLNATHLSSEFLLDLFSQSEFEFVKRVPNVEGFKSKDDQSSLKVLLFKKA